MDLVGCRGPWHGKLEAWAAKRHRCDAKMSSKMQSSDISHTFGFQLPRTPKPLGLAKSCQRSMAGTDHADPNRIFHDSAGGIQNLSHCLGAWGIGIREELTPCAMF